MILSNLKSWINRSLTCRKIKLLHFSIFTLLFYSCGGLSTRDLEAVQSINKKELTDVANQFLKHKEITQLTIASDYDSSLCQSINKWINCPKYDKNWKTRSDSLQKDIYLNSRLEVLRYERIDTTTFSYFHSFLKSRGLTNISRGYLPCKDCVEFEALRHGLRFYKFQPNILNENYEYIYVKRLDSNWFVYTRDWN